MIMSGFRAALDLDILYPLSNLISPRCAKSAKPGQGKPVLIMHIGFFTCFHAIPLDAGFFYVTLNALCDRCKGARLQNQ